MKATIGPVTFRMEGNSVSVECPCGTTSMEILITDKKDEALASVLGKLLREEHLRYQPHCKHLIEAGIFMDRRN